MDNKTVHKQPQVLLRGGGLFGDVHKSFISLYFYLKSYPIS